jgi:hypothetical protein
VTITTLGPVVLNNWVVQGSVLNNESICLLFFDLNTCASIVKFFFDEEDALAYLRYVTLTDTSAL